MRFSEFSRLADLHAASHRELTRTLIPRWLREGVRDLDSLIESSAYGETPPDVFEAVLDALEVGPGDRFLDLGAGAGNTLVSAAARGATVHGIERNAVLVEAGREYLSGLGMNPDTLLEADFLTQRWSAAEKLFAASARYSRSTLTSLAARLEEEPSVRRVALLGRNIQPGPRWTAGPVTSHQVRWNRDEPVHREELFLWEVEPSFVP